MNVVMLMRRLTRRTFFGYAYALTRLAPDCLNLPPLVLKY